MVLYKCYSPNTYTWFWSIEPNLNDGISCTPYEVKVPKKFSIGETMSRMKAFFRRGCDVAYDLTIADGAREDSPVYLIGGNPVEIVSLQVEGPVE